MAAAIGDGTVAPSVFLRTISTYRRQNKLNVALHELGRIERTLSTLDWLEQPELRRDCQKGLNKGEAWHALDDAIHTNRHGRFIDRSSRTKFRTSSLNLLIPAIAYWNNVYLGRAADHLWYSSVQIDEALLAYVSPLGWSHIGLTGEYLWEDGRSAAGTEYVTTNGQLSLAAAMFSFCPS